MSLEQTFMSFWTSWSWSHVHIFGRIKKAKVKSFTNICFVSSFCTHWFQIICLALCRNNLIWKRKTKTSWGLYILNICRKTSLHAKGTLGNLLQITHENIRHKYSGQIFQRNIWDIHYIEWENYYLHKHDMYWLQIFGRNIPCKYSA